MFGTKSIDEWPTGQKGPTEDTGAGSRAKNLIVEGVDAEHIRPLVDLIRECFDDDCGGADGYSVPDCRAAVAAATSDFSLDAIKAKAAASNSHYIHLTDGDKLRAAAMAAELGVPVETVMASLLKAKFTTKGQMRKPKA